MTHSWADVTGRGVISSAGHDINAFNTAILSGQSCISAVPEYSHLPLRFSKGAPVQNFVPSAHFDERSLGTLDRFSQFGVVAARQAWAECGLAAGSIPSERIGVVIGTANGGIDIQEVGWKRVLLEGKRPLPLTIPMGMGNAPASRIAREIGARGPVFAITTACASASHAMLMGMMLLRTGLADVVVAGGTDSCFNFGFLHSWDVLRVVSPNFCRPFSKGRQGLTIGEGAGIVVLERKGRAAGRGAKVFGHLLGGAMTSDAADLTTPDGVGMRRAMQDALTDAGLRQQEIGYINAHGTGTLVNDRLEAGAIRELFGAQTDRLPVSSSKSAVGHAMGASGAIEFLATLAALDAQIAPPTLNFLEVDPDCPIDPVAEGPRAVAMQAALSNSFAFGGLNVSLAVGKTGFVKSAS